MTSRVQFDCEQIVMLEHILKFCSFIVHKIIYVVRICTDWSQYASLREEIEHVIIHVREGRQLCQGRHYILDWPLEDIFIYFPTHVPCPFTTDKDGKTPLHFATRNDLKPLAVKIMLDIGADANAQDSDGRTPLHSAVAADSVSVFLVLVHHRATDLNARSHDGTTPLILATQLGRTFMVDCLIDRGADVNAADEWGRTALHWAAVLNSIEIMGVLLECDQVNTNVRDDGDRTPLFIAAREGHVAVCRLLLIMFADRDIKDLWGRLPKDVASERLHQDVVRILTNERMPAG